VRYLVKLFSEASQRTVKGAAGAMSKKSCGRQCCLSLLSACCQGFVALVFIALCFYFASLALTPVRILGITQLPPGIKYVHHDSRF